MLKLAFAAVFGLSTLGPAQRPNLLMIVADDLGPEMLGCYGGGVNGRTPNLDALAAAGLRFSRAYGSPACTTTRVQLMTGRHGFRAGVLTTVYPGQTGLPFAEFTLPDALNALQCNNAMIGKWHLGDANGPSTPNTHGWQHFAGLMYGGVSDYRNWPRVENGTSANSTQYCTSQQVDDALAWILQQAQPWALLLSFNAPHSPYHAPPAHLHSEALAGLDPVVTPGPFYRAMVEAMDAEIGRLLAGLGSQRSSTNVLFIADNGTPAEVHPKGRPASRSKGTVYEGAVHVPMIAAGPDVANPGTVSNELIGVVDFLPTAIELLGGTLSAVLPPGLRLDGVSAKPLLAGVTGPVHTALYTEIVHTGLGDGYALIRRDYKLIRFTGGGAVGGGNFPVRDALYDLQSDPTEQRELLAAGSDPRMEAIASDLLAELATLKRPGSVQAFGFGCSPRGGVNALTMVSPAVAGHQISVYFQYDRPGTLCRLYLGSSRTSFAGVPLPADLTRYGMPGCALQVSPDREVYSGTTSGRAIIRLPTDPSFFGAQIYLQAMVVEPGGNAMGATWSMPLTCSIGQ